MKIRFAEYALELHYSINMFLELVLWLVAFPRAQKVPNMIGRVRECSRGRISIWAYARPYIQTLDLVHPFLDTLHAMAVKQPAIITVPCSIESAPCSQEIQRP